jgi:hypothetical protein
VPISGRSGRVHQSPAEQRRHADAGCGRAVGA